MVKFTARMVENANFLRQYERHLVLRVGSRRDFLEVTTEGLIALDEGGHIVAANQRFLQDVGATPASFAGQHVEDVFGIRFDALAAAAQAGGDPIALRLLHSGSQCFALARQPRRVRQFPGLTSGRPSHGPSAAALERLAGSDARMAANVDQALRVLDKGLPVLLHGESGTGKEAFAKAMHDASARVGRPFVALNCAAIPETLIESELFGYKDGAFTGARAKGARGKVLQAHGGTLFLDEIGDMPLTLQAKLLRVLETGEVEPLASRPVSVDLRVVSATHVDIASRIEGGQFRADLYYRLCGAVLAVPPLRRRKSDIPGLADGILRPLAVASAKPIRGVTAKALAALVDHDWPGNVRELEHELQRLFHACPAGEAIEFGMLADSIRAPRATAPVSAEDTLELQRHVDALENRLIAEALARTQGNRTEAARLLAISRNGLALKMARLGLGE
jgi:transcriptional regulator with PAS, ATPase and Fis domain